ncbi:hypothetical protein TNCT_194351 [Trichonephila clavata]|uniref:Uncharacterized protein n=1 Tax=Trichonephila clavata TaxID=2740835 RepID=A0A8X6HDI6_TRICU|nr:hypothetical protein TNCT_194351 [Trichonephila clavata]
MIKIDPPSNTNLMRKGVLFAVEIKERSSKEISASPKSTPLKLYYRFSDRVMHVCRNSLYVGSSREFRVFQMDDFPSCIPDAACIRATELDCVPKLY